MHYDAYSKEIAVKAANYYDIINDDLFFAGLTAAADPEALRELKDKRRWANHKNKVPYNPRTGSKARSNDPNTCVYFREVSAALDEYDGVEFLLGDGLCAIDLDHCVDATGKIDEEAYQIVERLDSYAELSPSGTGIHILVRGEMPFTGRQGARDAALQIEMYSECRFITITGDAINNNPIADRTEEIKALAAQYFPEKDISKEPGTASAPLDPDNNQKMILSALDAIVPADCDYMQWIRIGVGLKEAGLGADVWDDWSSRDPDRYKPGECQKKWNTFKNPGQNSNGSGIIIALAKENGWDPGDAFGEDEKNEYFKNKAFADLQQMQHLAQVPVVEPVTEADEQDNEKSTHMVHSVDTANMRDRVYSSAELVSMPLQMPDFFVEGLIPEGATVLAGPSKIGKSLLAMDLAQKVSLGEDFMGRPTNTAAAMVYSLEDSWSRLKDRLIKQGHVCADPSNSPKYSISAPTYYDGLKERIEKFIQENGKSLIILDTLQLISPPRPSKVNDYDYYYPFLSDISKMARENHSSIILIHHTTKAVDENDPFNNILGSRAIQAATDAMIVITRNRKQLQEGKAMLNFTGRDLFTDEFELTFNKDNLTWTEATATEKNSHRDLYELDPIMITIRTIMEEIEADDNLIDKEYIVTMSDLLLEVQNKTNQCHNMTALQCGAVVRKYIDLLEEDGIAVDMPQGNTRAKGGKSARYFKFRLIG